MYTGLFCLPASTLKSISFPNFKKVHYFVHFSRPSSLSCVSITIMVTLFSQIIRQKSSLVFDIGAWVAIYAPGNVDHCTSFIPFTFFLVAINERSVDIVAAFNATDRTKVDSRAIVRENIHQSVLFLVASQARR